MSSQNVKQLTKVVELIQFARKGAWEKVENLIEHGGSSRIADEFGNTLLHWAASSGNLDVVKYLVWKGADVNSKNKDGRSPLYFAIYGGRLNIVQYFVGEKEVECHSPDRYGFTPLHYTLLTSGNSGVLDYILAQLCDKDEDGDERLNAKTKMGSTPLHLAAMTGKLNTVEHLIDKDVDCSLKNAQGMTPLHQAIVSTPTNFEMINCLVEADPEKVVDVPIARTGKTPLFQAVLIGSFSITETLVKHNANVNAKDKDTATPLQFAASAGHLEIVELLVEFNADTKVRNKNGKTALRVAAEKGHRDIAAYLENPPAPKSGIWFDAEEPTILFTGRRKELRNLHREVQRNADEGAQGITIISQMTSVSGLGGIGKSEIIKKYARQYRLFYDKNVVWINAENFFTLTDSFYRLAEDKLCISRKNMDGKEKDVRAIVREVYMYFDKQKEKCLFLFDNAEKYGSQGEGIEDFLPARNLAPNVIKPCIVITSRNQIWRDMKVIPLGTFSKKEAVEFIKRALGIQTNERGQEPEVAELASTLQYYPLALQQAVAYIKTEHEILQNIGESFTVNNYLEAYARQAQELLSFEFPSPEDGNAHYTKTTFTTWKITFDKIKTDKDFGKLAAMVLDIMSFLSPENIQARMFSKLVPNDKDLGSATQLLKRYSLISLTKPGVFTVHRLVQQVTRLELMNENQEQKTLKVALELVSATIKSGDSREIIKFVPHAISVWNHANKMEQLLKEFGDLPYAIIFAIIESGSRFEEAYSFGCAALMILESKLGVSNTRTLDTKLALGEVLRNQGKYAEALSHFEAVFEIRRKLYGPDHTSTLHAMHYMASALDDQGNFKQSVDLYKLILRKQPELEGPGSLTTLNTQNDYATALAGSGEYEQALRIFQELNEKAQSMLGADDPNTIASLDSIAFCLRKLGKYDESLALTEEVFAKRTEILGPTHKATMRTESELASLKLYPGQFQETDSALQTLILKQKSVLGAVHPDVITSKINIGESLAEQRRYSEALLANQEAYDMSKELLGPSHPSTLSSKNNVAWALGKLGNHKSALALYEELLSESSAALGFDHPKTLIYRANLAKELELLGRREEALGMLVDVYQKQMTAGPETRTTVVTLYSIAAVLFYQAKYEEALQTFENVLDQSIRILGQNNPATLSARNGVASSLEKLGRFDEARENFKVVFEKRVEILGPEHPDTVESKRSVERLSSVI